MDGRGKVTRFVSVRKTEPRLGSPMKRIESEELVTKVLEEQKQARTKQHGLVGGGSTRDYQPLATAISK